MSEANEVGASKVQACRLMQGRSPHTQANKQKVYFLVKFVCKWAALCDRTFEVGE